MLDLLLRNFRYTATRQGRQVQRFYETVLSGSPVMREIPTQSLNAMVLALEALARADEASEQVWVRSQVNEVFTAHDDLDSSLVGAEGALMSLADRFDLDDDRTGDLKTLLVGYATRIAVELDKGADRALIALRHLAGRYGELARSTVEGSAPPTLIGRDLLAASKGGDVADWQGLAARFDPMSGRSAAARRVWCTPSPHSTPISGSASGTDDPGAARGSPVPCPGAC